VVQRGSLAGLSFFLGSGPRAIGAEQMITGEYELAAFAAFRQLAASGGVLYDVGAHVGYYTCAWLALGGNRVEAFEPLPSHCRILRETLDRNGMADRAQVHPLALGAADGWARLIVSEADLGASSAAYIEEVGGVDMLFRSGRYAVPDTRPLDVSIHRLDTAVSALNLPRPDLIKLDVEGAEASVLDGGEELIARFRPAILCEVHNIDAALYMADRLARLGYDMQVLGKNGPNAACLWRAQ